MILFAVLLAQASVHENTSREVALCERSGQRMRFCLADQRHGRAERQLAAVLIKARRVALAQKQEIARFSATNNGVTLDGDPVRALEISQREWRSSYQADCLVVGLASATGNAGTEGVTAKLACEADRVLDRVEFLTSSFSLGE